MGTCLTLGLCLILVGPPAVPADAVGTTGSIAGSVDRLIEINRQRIIGDVDPDAVGVPKTFRIDLEKRIMRGGPDSLVRRVITIDRSMSTPGTLVLQGVDTGLSGPGAVFGWSLTIDTATGRAVLSAAGDGRAYVAFGACWPSPAGTADPADHVPER